MAAVRSRGTRTGISEGPADGSVAAKNLTLARRLSASSGDKGSPHTGSKGTHVTHGMRVWPGRTGAIWISPGFAPIRTLCAIGTTRTAEILSSFNSGVVATCCTNGPHTVNASRLDPESKRYALQSCDGNGRFTIENRFVTPLHQI